MINGTQPTNFCIPDGFTPEKVGKTFAYCLILVVSFVGNSLIAIVVFKTKNMQRTSNYFIVNLAMSDLLNPICVLPLALAELYDGFGVFSGQLGQAICKVVMLTQYISSAVSVESLVLIAVDRFGAVIFPLRIQLFRSQLCLFILASWILAFAFSFPAFAAYDPVEYPGKLQCDLVSWKETSVGYYCLVMPMVLCSIYLGLIIVLYSIILFKLKSQKIPGEQSINAEKQRLKKHRNVFKMVVAIVIGFVLCWGPLVGINFAHVFVWNTTIKLSCDVKPLYFITMFMARANCAINPCICFTFSGNYRQGLKGLLRCGTNRANL